MQDCRGGVEREQADAGSTHSTSASLVAGLRLDIQHHHRSFRMRAEQMEEPLTITGPGIPKQNTSYRAATEPDQRLAEKSLSCGIDSMNEACLSDSHADFSVLEAMQVFMEQPSTAHRQFPTTSSSATLFPTHPKYFHCTPLILLLWCGSYCVLTDFPLVVCHYLFSPQFQRDFSHVVVVLHYTLIYTCLCIKCELSVFGHQLFLCFPATRN